MNLKGNLSLKAPTLADIKRILPVLKRFESVIIGLILIGILGYTAFIVQTAINVTGSEPGPVPSISFDKPTLESLKSRVSVNGNTSSGNLGTSNPFGN